MKIMDDDAMLCASPQMVVARTHQSKTMLKRLGTNQANAHEKSAYRYGGFEQNSNLTKKKVDQDKEGKKKNDVKGAGKFQSTWSNYKDKLQDQIGAISNCKIKQQDQITRPNYKIKIMSQTVESNYQVKIVRVNCPLKL